MGDKKLRGVDPANVEIIYSASEEEFMRAMDLYKRRLHRPYPTWHEVLQVVLALGYVPPPERRGPIDLEPVVREAGRRSTVYSQMSQRE